MPLPIQTLPKGLIGLLNLNTDGRGPAVMADSVAGVLDLLPFYALDKRERLTTTAVAAGTSAGDFGFGAVGLLVPTNEAWLCLHYSIVCNPPIGLAVQLSPTFQVNGLVWKVGDAANNINTALASRLYCWATQPFIVPAGGQLAGATESLSAATAFSAFGLLDFVRFRL
jgi:hypothetical protein